MNESVELLRGHFDLTPSEARLALRLVAGDKLQSAAVKLDISHETARGHLKIPSIRPEPVGRLNLLSSSLWPFLPALKQAAPRQVRQRPPAAQTREVVHFFAGASAADRHGRWQART